MKRRSDNHIIDLLLPVGLLLVFAVCAITVLLLATRIYKVTVESSSMNYTAQTSLAYVTEKLHAHDEAGAVALGSIGDEPAVMISEEHDGQEYITYIYCHDGYLCELFTRVDIELSPETGNRLLSVSDFQAEQNDNVIEFSCTDENGNSAQAVVCLRS